MKFTEYIRTRKEAWRVESRRAVEDEFADVAPTINKLGFDRVASAARSSSRPSPIECVDSALSRSCKDS
jgi:hypothetical protein